MNKSKIITPILILAVIIGIGGFSYATDNIDPMQTIKRLNGSTPSNAQQQVTKTAAPAKAAISTPTKNYLSVSPLQLVEKPQFYLGKNVKFRAKFDKFSTLGLDYQPAYRSSEKYISLLIQRPGVYGHDIPLSELKIFVNRDSAEKHIDLNSGDEIEVSGSIFSTALGDAWMNVDIFTVLKTTPAKTVK